MIDLHIGLCLYRPPLCFWACPPIHPANNSAHEPLGSGALLVSIIVLLLIITLPWFRLVPTKSGDKIHWRQPEFILESKVHKRSCSLQLMELHLILNSMTGLRVGHFDFVGVPSNCSCEPSKHLAHTYIQAGISVSGSSKHVNHPQVEFAYIQIHDTRSNQICLGQSLAEFHV
jgi:hypothetical protein